MDRRRFLHLSASGAGAAIVLALGAACQQVQRPTPTRAGRPTPIGEPEPARRGPAATRDDAAVVLLPGEAESLEPPASSVLEGAVVSHVFDALTRRDPRSLEIVPELALAWRRVDPRAWELTVPRGAQFHDGSPADAEAVAFSLGRHARTRDPRRDGAPRSAATAWAREGAFASAEVLSGTTLRVRTERPIPLLPDLFATVEVVPPSQYADESREARELARKPVGSGPYTLVEWSPERLVLEAFDGYWGPRPSIKTIVFKPTSDPAARTLALLGGQSDLVADLPPDQIPIVERGPARVSRVATGRTIVVAMRVDRPLLADRRVRQALNHAFDFDTLNRTSLHGIHARARSVVNPPWEPPQARAYPYDPDWARSLLTEAGWAPGPDGILVNADQRAFSLVMDVPRGRYAKDQEIARAVQQDLHRIGIRVELRALDWPAYRGLLEAGNQADLYLLGLEPTFTGQQELQTLSRDAAPRATRWQNEEFWRLFDQLTVTMEPRARQELIARLWAIAQEDPPWIPICREVDVYGVGRRLAWEAPATERIRLTEATLAG